MATKHIYNNTPTPIPELGETYREVREKHELTLEEFSELKKIAEGLGLIFMITPFDLQSVEVCEKLKLDCYKIASHSMTDLPTLKKVASLRKPLFVSTGMSTPEEIDIAVKTIREYHNNFVLMHCVSSYPQKDEDTHLNMIDYLRDRYKCLVGYSGHEEGTVLTEAAVLKRAVAVERHFTLDKKMPGFDHKFSLSPQELFTMCQDIRRIERAMGIPEKKVLVSEMVARNAYRRSLVTVKPLKRGHVLNESDLTIKEPGTGVAPYKLPEVLGKKLKVDLDGDTTLEWPHLEK
jgi:sialic acid synthase SpsE